LSRQIVCGLIYTNCLAVEVQIRHRESHQFARPRSKNGRTMSRQRCDQFMKRYCQLAGIHRAKAHLHTMKHSIAMAIWHRTHQPGQIKAYLGHKSMSSTMQYLNESDSLQAQDAVSALAF